MKILVKKGEMPTHDKGGKACYFAEYDLDYDVCCCNLNYCKCDLNNGKCSGLEEFDFIKDDCK